MEEDVVRLKQQIERCTRESRASENRFRSVISNSGDGILVVNKSGIVRFANPAAEALFGPLGKSLVGAPFGYPVAAGETTEIDIIAGAGESLAAEMRVVETEWEGEPAFLASLRDVTERRRVQEERVKLIKEQVALARDEATQKQISAILESITDGFVALDTQARFTYINNDAQQLLKKSAQMIIGKSIWYAFPELAGAEFAKQYQHALDSRSAVEFEEFYGWLGVWLELRLYPSFDGLSIFFRDITRRKQTEAESHEQAEIIETTHRIGQYLSADLDLEKLARAVIDAANELAGAEFGSFFYNVNDGRGGWSRLFALSKSHDRFFQEFEPGNTANPLEHPIREVGTVRINDATADMRYNQITPYAAMICGNGAVTSFMAVPLISQSRQILGKIFLCHRQPEAFSERDARVVEGLAAQAAIAMDNARLYKDAQQALSDREDLLRREQSARNSAEIASRAKDEFLATLSHELRTPLNAIIGWTRLLANQAVDKDTLTRGLAIIDRNAKLQARLVDDMLDGSRIISGKLRLDVQAVDLAGVINAAVETLQSAADAKAIKIEVSLTYGSGVVLGDSTRLQQIVWNLLSNAIKFTPQGGRVQLQLRRTNSHFDISVSDTGPGIDPKFLPYIFDRFTQADSTAARRHGGLGLGLAIVRSLVELHGGTVVARNREHDDGAIFTISLPVMTAANRVFRIPDIQQDGTKSVNWTSAFFEARPTLAGLKVLAVDDDPDARMLLNTILQQCGAEVKTSSSTAEALEILRRFRPDVLVSDIAMPDEDGYVLIEKVRNLEPDLGTRIPAVALTAYASAEDRLHALSAGYDMHVPKPVEPAELTVVIASLIRQTRR